MYLYKLLYKLIYYKLYKGTQLNENNNNNQFKKKTYISLDYILATDKNELSYIK